MSTPTEHLRALKALPAAANAIIGASIRALHRPGAKRTAVALDLVRDLARAMRHYPMDSLIDAHWGETQARELRAERDAIVERANEQYLEQSAEIAALREAVRWYHGYGAEGWPEFPVELVVGQRYVFRSVAREHSDAVRRALEEKP